MRPYLAGRLSAGRCGVGQQPGWRCGRAAWQQSSTAATASERRRPGKLAACVRSSCAPLSRTIAFPSSRGGVVRSLPPCSPGAGNRETPSSLARVRGVPEGGRRWEIRSRNVQLSLEGRGNCRSTVLSPPHSTVGAPWTGSQGGGLEPGSTWLSANPQRGAGSGSLQKQRRVGQGACGSESARSISGCCKISRNLRKRLGCGAAIGPPGRGLGRAGEGRSQEVAGK